MSPADLRSLFHLFSSTCIIMVLLQYVKEKLGLATMNVEKVGSILSPLKITNPRNAPPDDILHIYKHIFVIH